MDHNPLKGLFSKASKKNKNKGEKGPESSSTRPESGTETNTDTLARSRPYSEILGNAPPRQGELPFHGNANDRASRHRPAFSVGSKEPILSNSSTYDSQKRSSSAPKRPVTVADASALRPGSAKHSPSNNTYRKSTDSKPPERAFSPMQLWGRSQPPPPPPPVSPLESLSLWSRENKIITPKNDDQRVEGVRSLPISDKFATQQSSRPQQYGAVASASKNPAKGVEDLRPQSQFADDIEGQLQRTLPGRADDRKDRIPNSNTNVPRFATSPTARTAQDSTGSRFTYASHTSRARDRSPSPVFEDDSFSAEPAITDYTLLERTEDTTVKTRHAQPVVHEVIKPQVHHIREEQIHREIHNHHVYHRILPIIDVQVLPTKHYTYDEAGSLVEIADPEADPSETNIEHLERNWIIAETVTKQYLDRSAKKNGRQRNSGVNYPREFTARTFEGTEGDEKVYMRQDGVAVTETTWIHPPTLEQGGRETGQTIPIYFTHYDKPISGTSRQRLPKPREPPPRSSARPVSRGSPDLRYREENYASRNFSAR